MLALGRTDHKQETENAMKKQSEIQEEWNT
jgi:hypothetical protein